MMKRQAVTVGGSSPSDVARMIEDFRAKQRAAKEQRAAQIEAARGEYRVGLRDIPSLRRHFANPAR